MNNKNTEVKKMKVEEFRKCHYCKVETECQHDREKEDMPLSGGIERSTCDCLADGCTFRHVTPEMDVHLHCLIKMIDKVLKCVK